MRTLTNAVLFATIVLSAPAFAGTHKAVAEKQAVTAEAKPVETKSTAPVVAPVKHARKANHVRAAKPEAVKGGEVKTDAKVEAAKPVEAMPAK